MANESTNMAEVQSQISNSESNSPATEKYSWESERRNSLSSSDLASLKDSADLANERRGLCALALDQDKELLQVKQQLKAVEEMSKQHVRTNQRLLQQLEAEKADKTVLFEQAAKIIKWCKRLDGQNKELVKENTELKGYMNALKKVIGGLGFKDNEQIQPTLKSPFMSQISEDDQKLQAGQMKKMIEEENARHAFENAEARREFTSPVLTYRSSAPKVKSPFMTPSGTDTLKAPKLRYSASGDDRKSEGSMPIRDAVYATEKQPEYRPPVKAMDQCMAFPGSVEKFHALVQAQPAAPMQEEKPKPKQDHVLSPLAQAFVPSGTQVPELPEMSNFTLSTKRDSPIGAALRHQPGPPDDFKTPASDDEVSEDEDSDEE